MKNGWKKVTLGDLISVSQGYTFKPEFQGVQGEKWQYFKVADIGLSSNKKYLITALNSISEEIKQVLKIKEFPAGSIAFPRVGAALLNNNKKILFQDSIVDDNTIVITPHTATINNEFLYYWFLTKQLKDFCNDGPVPVISSKNIKSSKILLPPISEQEKIAKTLSVWDSAIEKTEKLISEKEKKLQWIIIHYFEAAEGNKNWIVSKLSEFLKPGDKHPVENTANYRKITIKLHKNGIEYINSQRKMADTRPFYIRRAGELIIGKQNYFNGSIALLEKDFDGAICSNAIMSFSIAKSVNPDFLLEAISTKKYLREKSVYANGTGQKELSENAFLNFDVKLPSLKVQNEIMEIVNLQKSEISLLKKQLEQYKLQKQGLMQKLLTGEWRVK